MDIVARSTISWESARLRQRRLERGAGEKALSRTVESSGTEARRPRVVVLGGGFAGIGAARALKGVDAEVVVVDEHDYHTFQPLLYQLATDLLETEVVGHPLRDLFHEQPTPSSTRTR